MTINAEKKAFATSHIDQKINQGYLAIDFFFTLSYERSFLDWQPGDCYVIRHIPNRR